MISFRNKLVILTVSATAAGMLATSVTDYAGKRALAVDAAQNAMREEARHLTARVAGNLALIVADGRQLASTPPIAGIARTLQRNGPDPQDGSTLEQWRDRLAAIFAATLGNRPSYRQIRLIDLSGAGREVVRVERRAEKIATVAEAGLQTKASEPYFALGAALAAGEWAFSKVTPNREHGAIAANDPRMIRFVAPMADGAGRPFALIVVNVAFDQMLREAMRVAAPSTDTLLLAPSGDYLTFEASRDGTAPRIETGFDPDLAFDGVGGDGRLAAAWSRLFEHEAPVIAASDPFDRQPGLPDFSVALGTPAAQIGAAADASLRTTLGIAAAMLAITLLVTWFAARRFTAPLADIALQIRSLDDRQTLDSLPVARKDEIGVVARAIGHALTRFRDSQEQAQAVMNSLTDALVVIDDRGIVLEYSPSAETLFGWSADEVVGANVSKLMPPGAAAAHDAYLDRYRESGGGGTLGRPREVEGATRDGRKIALEVSVNAVRRAGRVVFVGLLRDITARRQADLMKNAFISTVNHELRTPLTSIRAALTMLESMTRGTLEDRPSRLIELAQRSSVRLSKLVDDILDLERMAAGVMEINPEALELRALVDDVIDRHEPLAQRFGVTFEKPEPGSPIMAFLDPLRFNQCLVNLLSNAAKFSPENGVVKCTLSPLAEGRVRISVADSGPGIPVDFRDRVFHRFTQARHQNERTGGGSGLGLAITRELIRKSGGDVTFETATGVGTVFHFVLPVLRGAVERPPARPAREDKRA